MGHGRVSRLVTSGHGPHDGRVEAQPGRPEPEPWPDGEASSVEDRGSFSHAVCRVCGWAGPGRRSRRLAREDIVAHTENGCDTPKASDTPTMGR